VTPDTELGVLRSRWPDWEFWRDEDLVKGTKDGITLEALSPWALDGRIWNHTCERVAAKYSQHRHSDPEGGRSS